MGYFGTVQIWDFDRRKILFGVPANWEPESVAFTPTESSLVIGSTWEKLYKISGGFPSKIEVLSKEEYERIPVKDPMRFDIPRFSLRPGIRIDPPERRDVYCLAVYPDGTRFAAGGGSVFDHKDRQLRSEPSVTVWDVATGRRILEIGSKENPIRRFCVSPDGRTLYSCGNKVLGWDAAKPGPPLREFDAHGGRMMSMAISPDGTMLAAGGEDGTVVIWTTRPARRLGTLTHDAAPVHRLAFSPTSSKLVAAGDRGIATVWTVELHSARNE
jgi:WD40 repeat protein